MSKLNVDEIRSADRVNYLRFKCSGGAGNLDKGTFRLYGYKKS